MKTSKDFSEIQEAADLIACILRSENPGSLPREERDTAPSTLTTARVPEDDPDAAHLQAAADKSRFRGGRLEVALEVMCRRGRFIGAVIADVDGLPFAVFNSPVGANAIAAFTSVLGDALRKAAHLLDEHNADNISMDVNYTDKVVLRRFVVEGQQYYLMVICPQNVDERTEIELSLEQFITLMT